MFSAYVMPMRTNSGSPGKVPGEVSWTNTAEPSSSVLIADADRDQPEQFATKVALRHSSPT